MKKSKTALSNVSTGRSFIRLFVKDVFAFTSDSCFLSAFYNKSLIHHTVNLYHIHLNAAETICRTPNTWPEPKQIIVARVINDDQKPYVSLCTPSYLKNCMESSKCDDPGYDGVFLKTLQEYSSFTLNMIPAEEWGTGADTELNSTFTYLKNGESCFVGPSFTQTSERDAVSKQFMPMEYGGYNLYFLKRYKSSDFSLFLSFRCEILVMMSMLLVANVLVHNIAKSSKCRKVFKIPMKLGFVLISILLNLYSSNLAIKSVEQVADIPNFSAISDLRNAVISNRVSLILPRLLLVGTKQITDTLLFNTTKADENILRRNLKYVDGYPSEVFNYLADSGDMKLMAIMDFEVDQSRDIKEKCHKVTKISGSGMFPPFFNGFYFTQSQSIQCSKFRKYMQDNREGLQALYITTKQQYLMHNQSNIKCSPQEVDFEHHDNSFAVLTPNFFENSIKSTLMYGLLVGFSVFILEIFLHNSFLFAK